MGIIKQGILGGFSGKVGSVVGSSWKGLATMKAMPLSVSNPRTTAQQAQRTWFRDISQLASTLLAPIVKPFWDSQAQQMSGYNLFVSTNSQAKDGDNSIDFAALKVTKGKMLPPTITAATLSANTYTVKFTMPANDRYGLSTDKCFVVILDEDDTTVFGGYSEAATRSQSGEQTITTYLPPRMNTNGTLRVYAFMYRADGTICSDSATRAIG